MSKSTAVFTRTCSLVIALLMLLSTFVSCAEAGDEEQTKEKDEATVEEVTTVSPGLTLDTPEMDFGGYNFSALSVEHDYLYTMLDVSEQTGEAVNDAIFNRNRRIEDEYGINFSCTGKQWIETYNILQQQVKSGDSGEESYDLIMLICREAYKATINNLLLSYDKLQYVDTSKDYYFKSLNDKFSIGNRTFFAYGYENINVLCQSCCLIYNKGLLTTHGIDSLYPSVDNGEWTFDKLFECAQTAASDADGDGIVFDTNDVLGIVGDFDLTIPSVWIAAGEYLVSKDSENLPVYTAGSERMIGALQKALEFFSTDYCKVFTANDGKPEQFMANKSVFFAGHLGKLQNFRAMEADYGIVPWPKYDEAQTEYVSRTIDAWLHVVPLNCGDTDRTSAIMQAIACYSYDTVYDAYYSQALSAKFVRDEDSIRMIKKILATVEVDLGDTIWYDSMRSAMVSDICAKKSGIGYSSLFKKYQSKYTVEMKKLNKFLDKLQDSAE